MEQMDLTEAPEDADVEVLDDEAAPFFAPAATDMLDGLLGQHHQARQRIAQLAGLVESELGGVVHYFIEGNTDERHSRVSIKVERLFETDGAIKALDAAYWSKAIGLTDVLDAMPQERRNEWHNAIREHQTPPFEEDTVRATIAELLASRERFFAERVDGIFQNLSRAHVTNQPEGFSKRMILAGVVNEWGHTCSSRVGYVNDLRCVIARFMGRDEPRYMATDTVVTEGRRRTGEWITLDGGALRMRVYKIGTAHLEVHPLMAYRLNQVLATLYPAAIPSKFRTKPKRQLRDFVMMGRPLPFRVVEVLASCRVVRERVGTGWPELYAPVHNARSFDYGIDPAVRSEAGMVMQALGGVPRGRLGNEFQFDYDPDEVLAEVVASGCIPDKVAHQFYPTPGLLARLCVEMAAIEPHHSVLEPQAGQAGIADHLPRERLMLLEVSALHCAILKAKGYVDVHQADFIAWAEDAFRQGRQFDRIVMNPPFSQGRAVAHVEAAARLLAPGGRLVSVLPSGQRGKELLAGLQHDWSRQFDDAFAGASVSVAILAATRPA